MHLLCLLSMHAFVFLEHLCLLCDVSDVCNVYITSATTFFWRTHVACRKAHFTYALYLGAGYLTVSGPAAQVGSALQQTKAEKTVGHVIAAHCSQHKTSQYQFIVSIHCWFLCITEVRRSATVMSYPVVQDKV